MKWSESVDRKLFPPEFRRFCCGIDVMLERNIVSSGSGTLTCVGVLTALHILKAPNNLKIEKINAVFVKDDGREFCVEVGPVLYKNEKQDIVVLDFPHIHSKYFNFVRIGLYERVAFDTKNIFAFGCPYGYVGAVWKAKLVGFDNDAVYTIESNNKNDLIVPGVSGGGLFTRQGNRWYLWAVHTNLAKKNDINTLESRIIKLWDEND